MKAFLQKYFWPILILLAILLTGIVLSLTSEVSHEVSKKKKEIKAAEKTIQKEKKKVAVFTDSIKAKDQKIIILIQEKKQYAFKDSLIQVAVQADIASGADTDSPAAAEKFLTNYSPTPYDTLR